MINTKLKHSLHLTHRTNLFQYGECFLDKINTNRHLWLVMPSNQDQPPHNSYAKDFTAWFNLKPILDAKQSVPPIAEREIWWCSVGVNVGTETDGKNSPNSTRKVQFTRPVLILKKLSRFTFVGIPLTSKDKKGSWYYPIKLKNRQSNLILSQTRSFDTRRLQRKIEKISDSQFLQIKKTYLKFLEK
jgi:mRNA interferase MazF